MCHVMRVIQEREMREKLKKEKAEVSGVLIGNTNMRCLQFLVFSGKRRYGDAPLG